MKDTDKTRTHYAEVAANWIKEGTTATLIELKKHTQNPNIGYTPYYTRAIRTPRDGLADIDVRHFCDLLGAEHCYPDTGKELREVLRESGYTCYELWDSGLIVIDANNPLLKKGE